MKSFSDYTISKDAITHNLIEFKKHNQKAKICAVVKADGYGIGARNVIEQIDDLVDFFAVACFCEAKKLRRLTAKPILVLNFVPNETLEYCHKNNISITVSSFEELKIIEKQKSLVKIHFAINTGMNRIGFKNVHEFLDAVRFAKNKKMHIEGIFTHFYNAKSVVDTEKQICIFKQFVKVLEKHFDTKEIIKHTSNSLGAVEYKRYNFDMVRLGILLYGSFEGNCPLELKQILNIKSKIINITKIKAGESVGYEKSFVAKKDMVVATIPLGYADGIMRCFSKKGKVLCQGKFCKVIGNICMDMFMIDITHIDAKLFDEVTLIGEDRFGQKISIDDFAKWCGTISYEILTNIKKNRFDVKIQ